MRFTAEQRLDDGVLEREFTLGEIPGILWTPGSEPAPLILIGHPGGFHKRLPRLVARARHYAAEYGFAAAAIDAPGCGDRPRSAADEQTGADLRRAKEAGEPIEEILEAFIVPMVDKAVPEWRTILDALLSLPEIGGPVGYEGMNSIGIRLAMVEPRVSAAVFFGMSFVPELLREEARRVTVPLQFLLQWDDEGNDRQQALDLFDTFGAQEKTLHANLGGHTGTPWFEVDDAARFFTRHLK
ncbi:MULTISPECIES: alpha/beta hydrolase [unclassified Crossiella]|uniref:alpha/beta hydrolase n=1 Tax=unclassified Crossiella TaxID=2620835 RepID=UPI001FFFCA2A|nr:MULTISPECIES: alpha/beta hydrolase [unclassified Crossiella]MCK2239411.1 alpha/beta hydrolase [Crossiella sp. S99.2]MCK2252106.1 alpha/beta hydrolase [Crossiella sp. S99.1]